MADRGARPTPSAGGIAQVTVPRISRGEFDQIAGFAKDHFGLELKSGKEELVTARLSRKLRQGGYESFGDYFSAVMADRTGNSLLELVDALTTNHTSFLREPAHFDLLTSLLAGKFARIPVLRIWCAACSTGEEPYTIAACLTAAGRAPSSWEMRATDISTRVLEQARRGVYREEAISVLPQAWQRGCFLRGHANSAGWYRVRPEISARIHFERFNLVEGPAVKGTWHIIFCRNVMIYFDKPTQERVVNRLAASLEPGGYLLVGHSESLAGVAHKLNYVQPATYCLEGGGTSSRRRA